MLEKNSNSAGNGTQVELLSKLIEEKCSVVDVEVCGYKDFLLDQRPDENISGLLSKISVLRERQNRVSSMRLDMISLKAKLDDKVLGYREFIKTKEPATLILIEAELEVSKKKTNKEQREALIRERLVSEYAMMDKLETLQRRVQRTFDIIREVDGNLRDAAIALSNQVNVVGQMVRIGEIALKPDNKPVL